MNRLILLDGLPGTGKTTNSYRLFEQLVRNGRDVRWLHEVSQPHPTLFFSEACLTIEGLPEILCFSGDNMVKLCGQQIIPQWSETGTIYTRENDMG